MSTPREGPAYTNGGAWAGSGTGGRPRHRRRTGVLVALTVALGTAALGIPYGLLWAALAPRAEVVVVSSGYYPADRLYPAASQPEEFIAGDGWFLLLGFLFGAGAAVAAWVVGRRWRGPLVLVALTAGAVGGGVLAWWLGHRIGLAEFTRLRATAPDGTRLEAPVDLHAAELGTWWRVVPTVYGVLLAEALAAAVGYTLLAGWSGHPALRPAPELAGLGPVEPGFSGRDLPEPVGTLSSDSMARPAPTTAPAPPAPGAAEPPRD